MSAPRAKDSPWVIRLLAAAVGGLRALALPVGACALVAVGVHAAADTVDDRILAVIERVEGAWDHFMGQWPITTPLIELLGLSARTRFARSVTLVWELLVDVVLALPALGYRAGVRSPVASPASGFNRLRKPEWRAAFRRMVRAASPMLWVRPLCTAAMVFSGACTVASMVQSSLYFDLDTTHALRGSAASLSRLMAVFCLGGLLVVVGWRPVWKSGEQCWGEPAHHPESPLGIRLARGLWGTALALPLALAATLDASPVLGFFR